MSYLSTRRVQTLARAHVLKYDCTSSTTAVLSLVLLYVYNIHIRFFPPDIFLCFVFYSFTDRTISRNCGFRNIPLSMRPGAIITVWKEERNAVYMYVKKTQRYLLTYLLYVRVCVCVCLGNEKNNRRPPNMMHGIYDKKRARHKSISSPRDLCGPVCRTGEGWDWRIMKKINIIKNEQIERVSLRRRLVPSGKRRRATADCYVVHASIPQVTET